MPKGRGSNARRRGPRQKLRLWQARRLIVDTNKDRTHHSQMVKATQGSGVKGPNCGYPGWPHKTRTDKKT